MSVPNKTEYTFPFDTCETPTNELFAQPYSVILNIVSILIVGYFLIQTRTLHAFILLLSLMVFEFAHTFSHFIHIRSGLQTTIVHILAYVLNFAFLFALYKYSGKSPSSALIIFLTAVLLFDIYAFFNLPFLYYVLTQLLFFFSNFIFYYGSLSSTMKNRLNIVFILTGIIYLGFINEAVNCKKMLEFWPVFPFHAVIEVLILFAVYMFCLTFYKV